MYSEHAIKKLRKDKLSTYIRIKALHCNNEQFLKYKKFY